MEPDETQYNQPTSSEHDFYDRRYLGIGIRGLSHKNLQPLFDQINAEFGLTNGSRLVIKQTADFHITVIPPPEWKLLKEKNSP